MAKFTHIHLHSEYSLLDGLIRIPQLVQKVKELGMKSVALTDHGNMSGVYNFWSSCKELDIKPIIGCEVFIAARTRFDKVPKIDDKRTHLVLLAKNKEGYHNLVKLVSLSHIEGFYYRPRVDKELIQKYGKGLIGLSACLSGVVNRHLFIGQEKIAFDWVEFLKQNLDEFYIEIQRNGIKESEKLIPKQISFAKKHDIPLVATCDSHYLEKEDWKAQEVLWAISDGKTLDDDTRRRAWSEEFYVKSQEEITKLYKDIPEVIENTQKIDECIEDFDITYERVEPKLPEIPKGITPFEYLKKLTYKGLKEKYRKIPKQLDEQVKTEISIIKDKKYTKYFLVCWDLCKFARDEDIWMGPGRGSAPSSVVAYVLGITGVEPLRWDLPFERFLNPERDSPPDIDLDFEDERRDEMFDYMHKRYGADTIVNICTFGRMKTRAAIRDVARVLEIDLEVADKLSKMVSVKFGRVTKLDDMMEESSEFKQIIDENPELRELADYVRKIEGLTRHVSMHACAMALAPKPMMNFIPVMLESRWSSVKRRIMTQIEGYPLEPMGFLKIDFLGLANLSILKRTINHVKKSKGIDITLDTIPLNDKKTYQLFQKAETTAIFQFESDGMKKYLRELKPESFEDIIFMVAAYRPGPMKFIPDYIARKHGEQKVVYPHPDTKPILEKTYGFAIYQEQVMKIAVTMAGYSMGEADILRRAMGKKKPEIMKAEKAKFIKGSLKKGYTKELANKLFSYMEPFADYGFNRSHSLCYALNIYWSAYLKANYPVEFMAGLMQTDIDSSDKIARDLLESERMGIKILPPHINKSDVGFTIEKDGEIRFGLAAIKNVGTKVVEKIVNTRRKEGKYKNLDDLVERVGSENLTKKVLECLIKAGTMDQFGLRNALLEIMPSIVDRVSRGEKRSKGGQTGLFDSNDSIKIAATPIPVMEEESEREKLMWEKELIGAYLTTHPLNKYKKYFGDEILTIPDAKKRGDKKQVKVGGIIARKKEIKTKKGNKPMAFLKIECFQDEIEGVVFNGIYEKHKEKFKLDKPYVFLGKTSQREGKVSIIVDDLKSFSNFSPSFAGEDKEVVLDISKEKDPVKLKILRQTIIDNPGDFRLVIYYFDKDGKQQKKEVKKKISLNSAVKSVIEEYIVKQK